MTARIAHRLGRVVALLVVGAVALGGCSALEGGDETPSGQASAPPAPAHPVDTALTTDGGVKEVAIGLVVSATSPPLEGSDWFSCAEGAKVAAYRFALGGTTTVKILVADDQGTAEGAATAVAQLASQGVSGIVAASSGTHLQAAVAAAWQAGLPLVMPYDDNASHVADYAGKAWTTGPLTADLEDATAQALEKVGGTSPFVIDAGGGVPSSVQASQLYSYTDGAETAPMTEALSAAASQEAVDSVLVTGNAHALATVVAALQGTGTSLPVVLSTQALSSVFRTTLLELGGSLSGNLATAGVADSDPSALEPTLQGEALSAYLTAVRLMTEDPDQTDLYGYEAFSPQIAQDADAASHDAVVALVRAAEQAKSTDPSQVAQVLSALRLKPAQGLAGPELDFSTPNALAPDAVEPLMSTPEDPGLRMAPGGAVLPTLLWFSFPAR